MKGNVTPYPNTVAQAVCLANVVLYSIYHS